MDINIPIPYARNPRNNGAAIDKVAASIKEFGFQQPIVVDKDNVVIVGHTRLLAAKKLGLKEVPVTVADTLNPQQVKAYRIADNKTADFSEFNDELLVLEIQELIDAGYNTDLTGFDIDELNDLLQIEQEGLTDEDYVPEVSLDEPTANLGDLYELGGHRLLCGDATKQKDVDTLMGGKLGVCVWVDPPYNVNYQAGTKASSLNVVRDKHFLINDSMDDSSFKSFLTDSFTNLFNNVEEGSPIYIAHAESERLNFNNSMVDAGFVQKQNLIWVKNAQVLSRQDYNWQHEPFLYGWKPGAAHRWFGDFNKTTVLDDEENVHEMDKKELKELIYKLKTALNTDVIREARPNRSDLHPTTKPVSIVKHMMCNSTEPHDIVIDTFGGSGTTLIACEKTNRKCYMMELDPHYMDVIIKRWEDFTGKKVVLIHNDKEST